MSLVEAVQQQGSATPARVTPIELSILIVTWNGQAMLERCLASLRTAAAAIRTEIVVVDNASADATDRMLASEFPEVRHVRLDANLGFAGANNRGAPLLAGEFVFLLNNDTTIEADGLEALLRAARRHPEFGVFAPEMVRMSDPGIVDNRGIYLDGTGHVRQLDTGLPVEPRRPPCEVFGASGGAMLMRREVVQRYGLFDETLESYMEDCDLACRLRAAGVRTLFVPDCVVHHEGSATGNRIADRKFYLIQRNMVAVHRRWFPFHPLRRSTWLGVAYELFQVGRAVRAGRLRLAARAKLDGLRTAARGAERTRDRASLDPRRLHAWAGVRSRSLGGAPGAGANP